MKRLIVVLMTLLMTSCAAATRITATSGDAVRTASVAHVNLAPDPGWDD